MPIFEYVCSDCRTPFDVLFKTREQKEEVICPACASNQHTKKFSTFAASVGRSVDSAPDCSSGSCATPYSPCAGGMCGLN